MSRGSAGSSYAHPTAFWTGATLVAAGVLAHIPGFLGAAEMDYRMAGMSMSGLMLAGMLAILSGMLLATYGLVPLDALRGDTHLPDPAHFQALDNAPLTRAHWGLLFVLGVALIVDVMKPATLGFIVPGMRAEYGLTGSQVALYPLTALTGTTIGSLLWGMLADRIGRRASILLASLLFMATSICGFMPSFAWNLFMCLLMGISAGGMLPIVYALMAESIPASKRGWLVVLHGGMGVVGGYLVAAGLAMLLEPHYTWRILWFAGLPTGFLVIICNRWIPESPRFLLAHGRIAEAERIMERYGIAVTERPRPVAVPRRAVAGADHGALLLLLRRPYLIHTMTVVSYGFGWGLVNWGFLTFVPTILRERGLAGDTASRLLFMSALIAVPATLLVAWLYGMWSSKKSMVLFALITVASLLGFAIVDPGAGGRGVQWLMPLTVLLLVGSGGVISMLSPYAAEVYPTTLRGTGSGVAAASSKVGGIIAPPVAALLFTMVPGFSLLGVAVAVPVLMSALMITITGVETRGRALEELGQRRVEAAPATELVS